MTSVRTHTSRCTWPLGVSALTLPHSTPLTKKPGQVTVAAAQDPQDRGPSSSWVLSHPMTATRGLPLPGFLLRPRWTLRWAKKGQLPPGCSNPSEPLLPSYPYLGAGGLGKAEGLRGEGEVELLEGGGHEGAFALGPVDEERPFLHRGCLQAQGPLQVQLCGPGR